MPLEQEEKEEKKRKWEIDRKLLEDAVHTQGKCCGDNEKEGEKEGEL